MTRYLTLAAVCGFVFAAQSALADTTAYEFTAKNNSAVSMTITVDGKADCTLEAGQSCRLNFKREDATLAYSLVGAAPVSFTTGNSEAEDLCNIDTNGAHCVDTMGQPTN